MTTNRFQDIKSFRDLVQAVSQGYAIPTTASSDLVAMYAKATKAAASSTAPSMDKSYFSSWKKFRDWCTKYGFDPFKTSAMDVGAFLSARAKLTSSPFVVEGDYYAIKSIRAHSGYPLENTPFLDAVRKGLCKASDPKDREWVGFETEQVQALLQHILNESDSCSHLCPVLGNC